LEPGIVINWRAFELRPEPVPMLDPSGEYLTNAWRNHVYPLARKMNMDLKLPPVQPRSRLAHEAAKWAGSKDRHLEYTLALFKAFFADGLDIGKIDVLAGLAVSLGLDPQDLQAVLDKNIFTEEVIADEDEAHRIGVNAVPAFAANGRVLAAGVQTVERLRSLINFQPLH
jgi:predicted DsbA family dithiol-disulfide isomerase